MNLSTTNPFLQGKFPKPLIDLKQRICTTVDFSKFFSEYVENFSYIQNQRCPFPGHDDNTPSFRAQEDGSYKCYGCNKSGSNIVQFWMHKFEIDFKASCENIYKKYIAREVPISTINVFHKKLLLNDDVLLYLEKTRGWSKDIIDHFHIGLEEQNDTKWVTIPVHNEYGFCVSILFYNVLHKEGQPKFYYLPGGDNAPTIYGREVIAESKKVYIFEGQPDWLLALSLGYPAITFGSCTSWKDSFAKELEGLDVVIVYDNDDPGRSGAKALANNFVLSAKTIKVMYLPKKDFTEYLLGIGFEKKPFDDLEKDTNYFKLQELEPEKITTTPEKDVELTTLGKAGLAENYNKTLRLVGLIAGKEPSPLLIPRKMQMTCQDKPTTVKCATCALAKSPQLSQVFNIDPYMKDVLKWVITGAKDHSKVYRESLSVNTKCKVDLKIQEMWGVEKVILNNPVKHGKFNELPERRLGFYFGSGLVPNRHYTFDLYSTQHPLDNSVVHVILHADPLDTELENFKLSPLEKQTLKCFQAFKIDEKFDEIYELFARNVTRIWGRPTLHLALDLPFFSPNEFMFAGEHIKRGNLDIMIYGDQRCGKGRIAEGLSNYYRFGEVLSGENTSFMNLVGGIESNDSFRGLKWGRIVANNGGVVIIDEASALEVSTIARLSRIRSEGLAELDKFGIHAKAVARCSLIWLSNPRIDPLSKFNFGIEALRELVGQPEDVARFDYAIAVRTNEVDADVINREFESLPDVYGHNLHRALILWCKTRRIEQIKFTQEAIEYAYDAAKQLAAEYTPVIPLLQVENSRVKLAKIAAAIAGRLFSCSEDGEELIVNALHMSRALKFLREIYESPVIAYRAYSKMVTLTSNLDFSGIDEILDPLRRAGILRDFLNSLLTMKDITMFDIQDITGLNLYDTRMIMGSLTREGALGKDGRFYKKSMSFINYIKNRLESNLENK